MATYEAIKEVSNNYIKLTFKINSRLGMVVHIHNPSTWEVEARSCKFKADLSYIMRLSLDKQTKIEKKITVKMVWNSSLNTSRGDGQNRTKDKFVQTL